MLYRGDDPIQDRSTKNRPVFGLGSSFGEPQQARLHETAGLLPLRSPWLERDLGAIYGLANFIERGTIITNKLGVLATNLVSLLSN